MSDVRIEAAGADRIDEVEPLWRSLQEHHAELDAVPAVRSHPDSWARRRMQYERWLGDGNAQLFLAMRGERAVGYVTLRMGDGASTWDIGDRTAEIETIAVLPEERSGGVGKALMDTAIAAAEAAGARAIGVGVVHSNAAAIQFYERAGFRSFYVELLRLSD